MKTTYTTDGSGFEGCAAEAVVSADGCMSGHRRCVQFDSVGCQLYGMMHPPLEGGVNGGGVGVLMLNSDDGCRMGPHGLWVRLADRLAVEGYPSFRFDYRGCGDSEGPEESPNGSVGLTDTITAERVFRELSGVRAVVLVGICYGAEIALLASRCVQTTCGVVACSAGRYVTDGGYGESVGHAAQYARGYASKLFLGSTWRKLIRGDVRVGLILHGLLTRLSWSGRQRERQGAAVAASLAGPSHRRIPQLFIYGSADPLMRKHMPGYEQEAEQLGLDRQFKIIPGADHNYASVVWSQDVIQTTLSFVNRVAASCRAAG